MSVRVDSIVKVTPLDVVADYDTYYRYYEDNRRFLWGTSFGKTRRYGQKEHIHMEIAVDETKEMYVVKRLEREKEAVLSQRYQMGFTPLTLTFLTLTKPSHG